MQAILKLGPAEPLLRALARQPELADQLIIVLGGVGDERAKTLPAGKLALTNITVEEKPLGGRTTAARFGSGTSSTAARQ